MNFDKQTYELINDFLDGKLPPEEKLAFENRLSQDMELQEELETYKLTNLLVKVAASNELRKEIQSGIKEYDQTIKSRWLRNGLIMLFAISLISASGIYWYTKKPDHGPDIEIASQALSNPDEKDYSPDIPQPKDPISIEPEKDAEPVVPPNITDTGSAANTSSTDTVQEIKRKDQAVSILDSASPEQNSKKDTTENSVAEKDPIQKKSAVPEPKSPDCSQFSIVGLPHVSAACAGKNDGRVDFSSMTSSDGSSDLRVSSTNGNKVEKNSMERLYSGYYTFKITNLDGCSIEQEVYVPEKKCFPKDFIINPTAGESWVPPVEGSEIYSLSIVDTQGKTVYSNDRVRNFSWNGTDQYGSELPAGLYVYLIKLGDQGVKSGQITIIR